MLHCFRICLSLNILFEELGYVAKPSMTIEQRLKLGANVEHILSMEKEAAKAPPRTQDHVPPSSHFST
jgi:hypothetical protein